MAIPQKSPTPASRPQPAKAAPPPPATGSAPPPEKVAARAYEIWQQAGRPDGQHEAHWYQAERELRTRSR
jgi:hypothetical protein